MTGRGEEEWGGRDPGPAKGRGGLASLILATFARTLAQESDRWFLWLPVVFAGGIVTYFALSNEPNGRVAVTPAAVGLAFLAFASGFAVARLGTEMVRAPVLARELRYAGIGGYVEDHELRDNGRTRLALLSEAAAAPLEVRIWA
jgi:competence protein ComEC